MRKLTIQEMHEIAKSRGGECLSENYVNQQSRLTWRCAEGHEWVAKAKQVKAGSWCRRCPPSRLQISDMKLRAAKFGGRCVSKSYKGARVPLEWECAKGHKWKAAPFQIGAGHWCPECAGNTAYTIEDARALARTKGGKCLSDEYLGAHKKLRWQCADGHTWSTTPHRIRRGAWCPHCAGNAKKSLADMQELANSRGGICLSDEYINSATKYRWRCEAGHEWSTTFGSVSSGQWCPQCSTGIGERFCRAAFETIFEKRFPTLKPKWLLNDRGNRMELDGYCRELNLAFEYHGEQHYKRVKRFQATQKAFKQRLSDDQKKKVICKKHKVNLIEVPHNIPLAHLRKYIVEKCREIGVHIPAGWNNRPFNTASAYSPKKLQKYKKIAVERGGKCLSEEYLGTGKKLTWECAKGHKWRAIPLNISHKGSWCPYCAGVNKKTIADMNELAASKNGKCLSKKYVDSHSNLKWECERGHRWYSTPTSIQSGKWCHECGGSKKKSIEDMRALARSRNGKCLSNTYINSQTHLEWQCEHGHRWKAKPNNIKSGKWCPECAGVRKLSILDAQTSAIMNGGHCLSSAYKNAHSQMDWQCARGHVWSAPYKSIRGGAWCPECRKSKSIK